jgi:hypothetical protein
LQDPSDGHNYITLSWGYDTEEDAISKVRQIAKSHDVPLDEIAVVKLVFPIDLQSLDDLPQ